MKQNCPNCGAKLKKVSESGVLTFECFSSTSENWPKPLISCTKGEKSFRQIKLNWLNKSNKRIFHSLWGCSLTYARSWFGENIRESKVESVQIQGIN